MIDDIVCWVSEVTFESREYIDSVFLFGSIAQGCEILNDCDLLFVCQGDQFSLSWAQLKAVREKLCASFGSKFPFPLSLKLFVKSEISELYKFYGPMILIKH